MITVIILCGHFREIRDFEFRLAPVAKINAWNRAESSSRSYRLLRLEEL